MDEKKLILLVDDDKLNLKLAQDILKEEYTIAAALSGEQAIAFVEKKIPSLILMDINMPGMDGFTAIKTIQAMENGRNVPFIFLTAQYDTDTEVRGFEMGAEDFIRKPFVSSIVKKRVRRAVESNDLKNNLQSEVEKKTKKVNEQKEELEQLSLEIIKTLATTIDAKDPYTKGHSSRVAHYSMVLAQKLGFNEKELEDLQIMALLHDVGKVGIPDRVLNKPGRLEEEEFAVIKNHTIYGYDILKGISSLKRISDVARHHHERYDGKGYPDGLSGANIEAEARIVGIADAYDAMSSNRVYRKALGKEVIRQELVRGRETQFDPNYLDIFLELFDAGQVEPIDEGKLEDVHNIDMELLFKAMGDDCKYDGAMKLTHNELTKMYAHLKNSSERYGKKFCVVLVNLEYDSQAISKDQLLKAMSAMEYSIIQCLRRTDITSRVSDNQQLIIMTETEKENAKIVMERVFAGYYKNYLYTDIKPVYEIEDESSV